MLTAFVLPTLLALAAGLLVCGPAAIVAPAAARIAMPILASFSVLLAAAFLIEGAMADAAASPAGTLLSLPLGPPGAPLAFGLDTLSAWFLIPVLVAALAAGLLAPPDGGQGAPQDAGRSAGRSIILLPVLVGGLMLALLAADALSLLLGLGIALVAGWWLGPATKGVPPLRGLAVPAAGAGAIFLALGLLGPMSAGFAGLHGLPAAGAYGAAALCLALLGCFALMGLPPLPPWLADAASRAPGAAAAVLAGATPLIGLYLLVRLLFGIAGPLQPGWWGWPLLALGALAAIRGSLRANFAEDLPGVLVASGAGQRGIAVAGLGAALVARGADLPPLAALALGAVLLQGAALVLSQTLLLLVAASVEASAATRRLDRLGGLAHAMGATLAACLVGAASLACLPPSAGFAAFWLLIQALIGELRVGGIGLQALLALAAAAIAFATSLGVAAMVRMVGIAFLGRPRAPRGAAAEPAPPMARRVAFALAALLAVLGLLPGPAIGLAGPALRQMLGTEWDGQDGALGIAPQAGLPAYSAPALAGLVILALLAVAWITRRRTARGEGWSPAWESGFAAAPPWLPFGDPLTEIGPSSFAPSLRGTLGRLGAPVPRRGRLAAIGTVLGRWSAGVERAAEARAAALVVAVLAMLLVLAAL